MSDPLSVSALNNQIKSLLETHYSNVYVKGEISRVTYHTSGHIYFSLKDESSTINCVMFKGNNKNLKFRLEDGMSVVCFGGITVYPPRGSYQLNIMSIEPEGSGALALAFEQLKKKLEEKGYFDPSKKKSLPPFPKKIVLVTSKTGAALQDMLRVARKRFPLVKFILIDTQVQGEGVQDQIAKNIDLADTLQADIIVVARGGGSVEDLWNFNEEVVAEAIFRAKTPVISAIGHEIDFLISDFVADIRAATPSNAMEIALPDINELLLNIDNLFDMLDATMQNILSRKKEELFYIKEMFIHDALFYKIKNQIENVKFLSKNFDENMKIIFTKNKREVLALLDIFEQYDPKKQMKKGFAQVLKNDQKIYLKELKEEDEFEVLDHTAFIKAKVLKKL